MTAGGRTSRRAVLAGAGGLVSGLATGAVDTAAAQTAAPLVRAEPVADGFTAPLDVASPPDAPGTHLVVDQVGVIHRVTDGTVAEEPYLDLRDRTVDVRGGYSEQGLLGLALAPDYPDSRRLYVRYSAPRRPGTPTGYAHTAVLAALEAGPDGKRVDPSTERTVLEIPQPQPNHNAGGLVFGPDGYLLVGVGDGGGANDVGPGHAADWYATNRGGNGQDVTANLLGSVLRIDPTGRDGNRGYAVPPDNPLVGAPGLDEQYAWGFRNPWRLSVDDGDVYVADVGQNRREEVNLLVRGGNYGWNVREGTTCFSTADPGAVPDDCPTTGPGRAGAEPLRDPLVEYTHAEDEDPGGVSVVGGHRYRGAALEGLEGAFVFADYRSQGRLFVARPSTDPQPGEGPLPVRSLPLRGTGREVGPFVLCLGETRDDELLVCSTARGTVTGETGRVHRLSAVEGALAGSGTTSGDGGHGFGPLAALAGVAGLAAWAGRRLDRRS